MNKYAGKLGSQHTTIQATGGLMVGFAIMIAGSVAFFLVVDAVLYLVR